MWSHGGAAVGGCRIFSIALVAAVAATPVWTMAAPTPVPTAAPCAVGQYRSTDGCTSCPAGTFMNESGQQSTCFDCEVGRFQPAVGQAGCFLCDMGKFGAASGRTACEFCPSGRYASTSGQIACDNCTSGTYSSSTGAHECTACREGDFAGHAGADVCLKCSSNGGPYGTGGAGYTSDAGASSCSKATEGYYLAEDGVANPCPEGAVCDKEGVTLASMGIRGGWYRFSSTSTRVFRCPSAYVDNCPGHGVGANSSSLCIEGASGPLCQVCLPRFYLSEYSRHCESCKSTNAWLAPMLVLIMAGAAAGAWYRYRHHWYAWYEENEKIVRTLFEKAYSLFVTMQILWLLKSNHDSVGGSDLPRPYVQVLNVFSFIALDAVQFMPISCAAEGFDHLDGLLIMTLVPLVVLTASLIAVHLNRRRKNMINTRMSMLNKEHVITKQDKGMRKRTMMVYFLEVLLLALPTISRHICHSFRCKAYEEEGVSYLDVDFQIPCDSARYRAMNLFALAMMLVYPFGVPLLLFCMLSKFRKRFNPPSANDEAEAVQIREADIGLRDEPISSFAIVFRPRFWWYECYNILRRLVLTSVVLVCTTLAGSTVFVVFVSITTLVIERECNPYLEPFLSSFLYVMHWQIVIFVLFLLLLDANMSTGAGAVAISSMLMVANMCMMAVIFFDLHSFLANFQKFLKFVTGIERASDLTPGDVSVVNGAPRERKKSGRIDAFLDSLKDHADGVSHRTGAPEASDTGYTVPPRAPRSSLLTGLMHGLHGLEQAIVNNVLEIYDGDGHTRGANHGSRARRATDMENIRSSVEKLGIQVDNPMHKEAPRRSTLSDLRSSSPSTPSPPASPKLRSSPPSPLPSFASPKRTGPAKRRASEIASTAMARTPTTAGTNTQTKEGSALTIAEVDARLTAQFGGSFRRPSADQAKVYNGEAASERGSEAASERGSEAASERGSESAVIARAGPRDSMTV